MFACGNRKFIVRVLYRVYFASRDINELEHSRHLSSVFLSRSFSPESDITSFNGEPGCSTRILAVSNRGP
jgi:hypothetical protein